MTIYQENTYHDDDGRIIRQRAIVVGKAPTNFVEFYGSVDTKVDVAVSEDGSVVEDMPVTVTFPIADVAPGYKGLGPAFAKFDALAREAVRSTIAEYDAKLEEFRKKAKSAAGPSRLIVPGHSSYPERHIERGQEDQARG